jgi:hypothetical protein
MNPLECPIFSLPLGKAKCHYQCYFAKNPIELGGGFSMPKGLHPKSKGKDEDNFPYFQTF